MAQVDGAIRIVTKITTKDAEESLASLEWQIKKSAKYMDELRAKIDTLKDQKIPTKEYEKLQEDLKKAEKELSDLISQQNEWEKLGVTSGGAWDTLNEKIATASDSVDSIKEKMQSLVDAGKGFVLGQDTEQYKAMEQQLQYEEEAIVKAGEHYQKLKDEASGASAEEQRLAEIKANATVSDQEIISLLERRKQLLAEIADMERAGVGLGYQRYEDANRELEEINGRIRDYKSNLSKVPEQFNKMQKSAKKAFDAVSSGAKKSSSSVSGGLKTILKYSFGIRSLYALIGKLRSAMKEGFANLAQFSAPVNDSISMLMSSLLQLKNSLATAFAPILNAVAPTIKSLIDMLSQAATQVGMFIAALTGASSFAKAVAVQKDYAKSLNGTAGAAKKAAGALAKFDDLDVLQNKDDAVGGFGDVSVGDMFEEVQVDNEFSKIAKEMKYWIGRIKEIIQDFLTCDFFQAGKNVSNLAKSIMDFFAKALKNVNWNKIGENIGKFFSGIDWVKVLKSAEKLFWTALKSVFGTWSGAFDAAPIETGIITAVGLLKFTGLGEILGTKINTALGKVSEGLNLKSLAIAIEGVFGEFVLVSDAFEGLISKSKGVGSALIEMVAGVGLAVGALKLIGLSNLWGAVIVGITGVAGAIMGMKKAQEEALEKFAEEQELRVFGDHLSNITTKLNESAQATKGRMAASIEYVQNAGVGEMQMAKDLADRYFTLAENVNRTNAETEEMQRLAGLLVEKAPELNQYYDEQTGLLNGTRDAINGVIDARLKEIQLNAISEELTEAYKERRNALKSLGEATDAASNAQEEMNRLQKEFDDLTARTAAAAAYQDISTLISIGLENLNDTAVSQELLNNLTDAGVEGMGKLVDLRKQLYDIVTKHGEEEFRFAPGFIEDIEEVGKEIQIFTTGYNDAMASFENSKSAYDTVERTISDLSQMMSEGMQGVGGDFSDGYAEGILSKVEEVEKAGKKIADSGISSLQKEQDSNSPSKVTMGLGEDFVDGYNKGIADNKKTTIETVSRFMENVKAKFSELIHMLKGIGINAMRGLLDGLISMEDALYQKAEEIANNIANTIKKALEIHSPSRVMFELGEYTMQGFANGIESVQAISGTSIPRLATGAVIRGGNPFMAILGDQPAGKTNIEAPLSAIEQAMENVVSRHGASGERLPVNINVIYDGETTARVMIPDLLAELDRQGYNVDILGVT